MMTMRDWFRSTKVLIFKFSFAVPAFVISICPVLAEALEISNFGHSSMLIRGGGKSILLNPFKPVGCASGLIEPNISADVILSSSILPDEGSKSIGKGLFLVKPGSYLIDGISFEGTESPHDRVGGRRFGMSTLWKWEQGGLSFAHLGGAAAPLTIENRLIIGNPDVLFIAVGGGSKIYNGQEAAKVVDILKPKIVIPVQYQLRDNKKRQNCDQEGIESFLEAMEDYTVEKVGKKYNPKRVISNNTSINLME
tara:strand:- start:942 stop:1697 length:756 start_codon:yes stop_codon:yes gene_type:complete